MSLNVIIKWHYSVVSFETVPVVFNRGLLSCNREPQTKEHIVHWVANVVLNSQYTALCGQIDHKYICLRAK